MSDTQPNGRTQLEDIAQRLSLIGDAFKWSEELYVFEPGDDGERYGLRFLVSADGGILPEPIVVAAEIDSPEIAQFIANAPRDIRFLLAELAKRSQS